MTSILYIEFACHTAVISLFTCKVHFFSVFGACSTSELGLQKKQVPTINDSKLFF